MRLGCFSAEAKFSATLTWPRGAARDLKAGYSWHVCQTSKTRVRARLDIRTERLAQGARSASEIEMQSCWLDNWHVSIFLLCPCQWPAMRALRISSKFLTDDIRLLRWEKSVSLRAARGSGITATTKFRPGCLKMRKRIELERAGPSIP